MGMQGNQEERESRHDRGGRGRGVSGSERDDLGDNAVVADVTVIVIEVVMASAAVVEDQVLDWVNEHIPSLGQKR